MRKYWLNLLSPVFMSGLIALGLIACGGSNTALINQQDISQAQQNGNLESLYAKSGQIIQESSGSSKKQAIATRDQIAKLLIADRAGQVDKVLQQRSADANSVTRVQLSDLENSLAPMQEWSATEYTRNLQKVQQALRQHNSLIADAVSRAEAAPDNSEERILALREASRLAGAQQPEAQRYQQEYEATMAALQYQGSEGLSQRLYKTAINASEQALKLDPGNIQFESMLAQGQAGLFEKDFRFALEQGKPDSAYESMMMVVDKPIFFQLKNSMGKSMLLLANYFAGAGQKAYQASDFYGAYSNFQKGRNIQRNLDIPKPGFVQETQYLQTLLNLAAKPEMGEGKRLAYLRVIEEFDSNFPGLESVLIKSRENIVKRAMTKLSIAEFKEVTSNNSVVSSVGRRVGSKLEQKLFEQLGKEVLIVSDTHNLEANGFGGLALRIDGEILQAAIEVSRDQGRRSQRVQTGIDRQETEEYTKWAKRKRGDAPTQYTETPIEEDVELIVEHIRKQAIAEVAFRVIAPSDGSILMTEAIVKESEFSGESINEFQKGDFHQPYVRADLPSDIKIMDTLATELAQDLGKKLGDYLQSPEQVFYQKAKEEAAKGDLVAAVELMSNAVSIGENKNKPVGEWYAELTQLALGQK